MRTLPRIRLLVAWLLVPAASLFAQTPADPSGHWEGRIQTPEMNVAIEVDLTTTAGGQRAGAISIPAQNLKGLPLARIAVQGASISFEIGAASADRAFTGSVSADGKSMSGDYTQSGFTLPFSLTRTGEARVEAAIKNAPIAKELEGTWNGTLAVDGAQFRLVLTLSNHPDGTSTGGVVNLDQANLEIPVSRIIQEGSTLSLDFRAIGGAYAGVINAERTELVGTFSQGPRAVPLTFHRTAGTGR